MTTLTQETVAISVDYACCGHDLAADLHAQLSTGAYDRCSAMPLPSTIDEWRAEHRTARKRWDRCVRRGYRVGPLAREHHADEIFEINTSADYRQGRPMSAGYRERQEFSPLPDYPCGRHAIRIWGAWTPSDVLVAYIVMMRAGDLALVSQILGHDEYLDDEMMFALFGVALVAEIEAGPGFVVYNRHDSGTPGLVWFKERLGFVAADVEWIL